jgi:hypothetical protein
MRSRDGGRTWGAAERAGFRAGHRDGMPVPVSLADGSGVAVAIEDNGWAAERSSRRFSFRLRRTCGAPAR